MKKIKTGILISGRGSNMAALIKATREHDYPAEIVLVISNKADAPGLGIARREGIKTSVVMQSAFATKAEFEAELQKNLLDAGVELICLAGFMRVLSADFVNLWQGRLINIHPSLLPAYRGLHTHERALADGAAFHGCTVHHVVAALDAGPTIAQEQIPVLPDDTAETLAARVLEIENRLYPRALARVAKELIPL